MYKIPSGDLKNYYICETCGSILDIYIEYHRCLLDPHIVNIHLDLIKGISKCPFYMCTSNNNTVSRYMEHLLKHHQSVIIFTCHICSIGFITKSGVAHHKNFCSVTL